jgi:hypothetical protein
MGLHIGMIGQSGHSWEQPNTLPDSLETCAKTDQQTTQLRTSLDNESYIRRVSSCVKISQFLIRHTIWLQIHKLVPIECYQSHQSLVIEVVTCCKLK